MLLHGPSTSSTAQLDEEIRRERRLQAAAVDVVTFRRPRPPSHPLVDAVIGTQTPVTTAPLLATTGTMVTDSEEEVKIKLLKGSSVLDLCIEVDFQG